MIRSRSLSTVRATVATAVDALVVNCGAGVNCTDARAVAAGEARAYNRARSLQTNVIADSGHDLNLQRNAPSFFSLVNDWIASR
jgi:hypothetical protein